MVHVFRLGPLEAGGRKAYAYSGLDADGGLIPPEITHTDAKGLGALAKRYAGVSTAVRRGLARPGPLRWFGGFGTSWFNDPGRDLVAIVMNQSSDFLFSGALEEFWRGVYEAIG